MDFVTQKSASLQWRQRTPPWDTQREYSIEQWNLKHRETNACEEERSVHTHINSNVRRFNFDFSFTAELNQLEAKNCKYF